MDNEFPVPQRESAQGVEVFLQTSKLQAWIQDLPRGNAKETTHRILVLLEQINRTHFPEKLRASAVALLKIEIDPLIETFAAQYHHVAYPLTPAKLASFAIFERLFSEMALAYSSLLYSQVAELKTHVQKDKDAIEYCAQSLHYQALNIIHIYSLYSQIPKPCWEQLHTLYRCCERYGLDRIYPGDAKSGTLADRYAQVLMVSLSMPFQLMQGEAYKVYEAMGQWFGLYRLLPEEKQFDLDTDLQVEGKFYVDLMSTSAPAFGHRINRSIPIDPRVIDMHLLIEKLNRRVEELVLKSNVTFSERMERNLLRRLAQALTHRPERACDREEAHDQVLVIIGLQDCHHHLYGDREFQPDAAELLLHETQKKSAPASFSGLSLAGVGDSAYQSGNTQDKLERGKIRPRTLAFDREEKSGDVWARNINVQDKKSDLQKAMHEKKNKQNQLALIKRNQSAEGIGLYCPPGGVIQVRVGEIAGMAAVDESGNSVWTICIVKWIRSLEDGGLDLGIQSLCDRATPVAVRGIGGKGADTSYIPGILVRRNNQESLIVSSLVYDLQSVLLVNYEDRYELIRLSDMVRSTKSFNQYIFEPLPRGEALDKKVYMSLQKLLT